MPTFVGCKATDTIVAFALPESSDAQAINCEVEGGEVGFLVYGSAAEVAALTKAVGSYPKELEELKQQINALQNPLHVDKECIIRKSSLFEMLNGTASAVAIIDFLIKLVSE